MADATRPIKDLTVIDDGLLAAMAASDRFTAEFPFLKGLAVTAKKKNCGRCARRSGSTRDVYLSAKATLASLTGDKKRKLKELLNTRKARVSYLKGRSVVQLTF